VKRLFDKLSFIDFVNAYSLWVVIGSFVTFCFFSKIFGITPDYVAGAVLALSIWIIYTADHLFDGFKLKDQAISMRHKLHFEHRKILLPLILFGFIACIILVFGMLSKDYFKLGWFLCILTLIHFIINLAISKKYKNRLFLKEVFIAIVVTMGFSILPLTATLVYNWMSNLSIVVVAFFLLNLSNLLLFSYFDFETDEKSNFLSAAHVYGKEIALYIARIAITISIVLIVYLIYKQDLSLLGGIIIVLMNCTLLHISIYPDKYKQRGLYRFWGDFIYVIPAIAIPFL